MINILITGVGGPTPLGIAKSLLQMYGSEIRLIGTDANPFAPGLYNSNLFNKTYRTPHSSKSDYWNAIEEIVSEEKIHFAFVVPEIEVIEWARYKQMRSLPCNSLIPDLNVAEFLYDKLSVSNALVDQGLTPQTIEISNLDDAKILENKISYPYWVRIRTGAGAVGSFKIEKFTDIENWLKVNPANSNFIASPYLSGRNYACKVLFKDGKLVMAASAERIGYLLSDSAPSGISGMCAHGKLINNKELVQKSISALKSVYGIFQKKPNGMFTVDFKESAEGVPFITEINIRHVSFTHAYSLAGANFSSKTLDVFYNEKEYSTELIHFDKDYTFIRGVDTEIFVIENSKIK